MAETRERDVERVVVEREAGGVTLLAVDVGVDGGLETVVVALDVDLVPCLEHVLVHSP